MRWSMKLAEYNYTVQHRPGKGNANADALSRCPVPDSAPSSTEDLDSPVRRIHYTAVEVHRIYLDRSFPFPEWQATPALISYVAQAWVNRSSKKGGEEATQGDLPPHLAPFALADLTDARQVARSQREDPTLLTLINYKERREMPANFSEQ